MPATLQALSRGWGAKPLLVRLGSVAGIFFVLLLVAFVSYSALWKTWCLERSQGWGGREQVWGGGAFGETVGVCTREKSLFAF